MKSVIRLRRYPWNAFHQWIVDSTCNLNTKNGWTFKLSYLEKNEIVDLFAIALNFTEVVSKEPNQETKDIISKNEDVFCSKNVSNNFIDKLASNGTHRIIMNVMNQYALSQTNMRVISISCCSTDFLQDRVEFL
jgi:hypothetical protein